MICLETRLVVAFLNGKEPAIVDRLLREIPSGLVALPALVLFELQYGAAISRRRGANEARLQTFLSAPIEILAFDEADAREAADIGAALEQAGATLAPYDLLIAAQTRRRDAVLAIDGGKDFSVVPGLRIENWAGAA